MTGTFYLIPSNISESPAEHVIPPYNIEVVLGLKYFFVENIRSARRFLAKCGVPTPFEGIEFITVNKRTSKAEKQELMTILLTGNDAGFISEAGCPAIADPGPDIALLCHDQGITVKPLVGPSSILLALIASGLNGQSFTFHGYLPIKEGERIKAIKAIENESRTRGRSQIFMETPYRNMALLGDILKVCSPSTKLCIASGLTGENEKILTLTIADWRGMKWDIHKVPAIFVIC